jgi:hypothetical protein
MPIIQFAMPSRNKPLKHIYWEECPKYDKNAKYVGIPLHHIADNLSAMQSVMTWFLAIAYLDG